MALDNEYVRVIVAVRRWDDNLDVLFGTCGHNCSRPFLIRSQTAQFAFANKTDDQTNLASVRQCTLATKSSALFDPVDEHGQATDVQVKLLTIC